jgi:hypothetical protein
MFIVSVFFIAKTDIYHSKNNVRNDADSLGVTNQGLDYIDHLQSLSYLDIRYFFQKANLSYVNF